MGKIKMNVHLIRAYQIYDDIKLGWDRIGFVFYLSTPAIALGALFGLAGVAALAFTLVICWSVGKLHKKAEKHINGKSGAS